MRMITFPAGAPGLLVRQLSNGWLISGITDDPNEVPIEAVATDAAMLTKVILGWADGPGKPEAAVSRPAEDWMRIGSQRPEDIRPGTASVREVFNHRPPGVPTQIRPAPIPPPAQRPAGAFTTAHAEQRVATTMTESQASTLQE